MSETTNPGVISPFVKAESGKADVSVNVGTAPAPHDPSPASKSSILKDSWPMIAFLIGAVFSAGVLWNKVNNLEKQQDTFRVEVQASFAAVNKKLDDLTPKPMDY
jgi:hypothetical protein